MCSLLVSVQLLFENRRESLTLLEGNGNRFVTKFSYSQFRESSFRIFKQICLRKHAKITKNSQQHGCTFWHHAAPPIPSPTPSFNFSAGEANQKCNAKVEGV